MLHKCWVSDKLKKRLGSLAGQSTPGSTRGLAFRLIQTPIFEQAQHINRSIHYVPVSLESSALILGGQQC